MPIIATPASLIEHCEKYLFFYSGGVITIHADDMNIFEKGLMHQYVYVKIEQERIKEKKKWFMGHQFFPVFSYLIYKGLKQKGAEASLRDHEDAANAAIEKMLRFADFYDKGEPPDDKDIGEALIATMKEGAEEVIKMFKGMRGGKNAEGEN